MEGLLDEVEVEIKGSEKEAGTMKRTLKRASKWLLLVMVLGEALFVWLGVLEDLSDAVLVVAGLEALMLFLVLGEALHAPAATATGAWRA